MTNLKKAPRLLRKSSRKEQVLFFEILKKESQGNISMFYTGGKNDVDATPTFIWARNLSKFWDNISVGHKQIIYYMSKKSLDDMPLYISSIIGFERVVSKWRLKTKKRNKLLKFLQ